MVDVLIVGVFIHGIALGLFLGWLRWKEPTIKYKSSNEIYCPVCGYYCLGKGGIGCIDKPSLVKE